MNILREPLLHFLLASAVIFLVYGYLNPSDSELYEVRVSEGRVQQLFGRFEKTWGRKPTEAELQKLIDSYVLDEVYSREARILGLDQEDGVVKKRLRQKMEFMLKDMAAAQPLDEEKLRQYFEENKVNFRQDNRYTFSQVLAKTELSVDMFEQYLIEQNEKVKLNERPIGKSSLLPSEFSRATSFDVDRQFGQGFSKKLDAIEVGKWSGLIESGLGNHFIFISNIEPGADVSFSDVRSTVESEYRYREDVINKEKLDASLSAKYEVIVELPDDLSTL